MTYVHILMAVLASWRLTEIVTQDRISEPIRKRWPWYIWTCHRCVSVWASAFCALSLYLWPWSNWPLGLAWLYLWHLDWIIARRKAKEPPKLIVEMVKEGQIAVTRSDFGPHDVVRIGEELIRLNSSPKQAT